jgi:UDP-N-acetylglucosamine 2-epimerase (non-hydrolysing)
MAPVVRALRSAPQEFKTVVVATAQHRQMLDQVMSLFKIDSDHDLNIMQANQSLEYVVCEVLTKLAPILKEEKPDLVLVHGDTITTFAASLAAFYQKIPIGHVEAGLRSYDMENPFPEESNRLLADHLCALHFAPTRQARQNLREERIPQERVFVTGNTVADALFLALKEPHRWSDPALQQLSKKRDPKERRILVTAHRRENHGAPLENVFRALRRIVDEHADVRVIYPVHLNPNVQKPAQGILGNHERISLIPPVDYLDLVNLLKESYLVVTDSGGIQEEAPSLGKPVLVLRKVTERPEAMQAGVAKVIGVTEEGVHENIRQLLEDARLYKSMSATINPYGDGHAAPRILDAIRFHFGSISTRPEDFNIK